MSTIRLACGLVFLGLLAMGPTPARADIRRPVVTTATVSAFPEPTISATAAIEIARLASERGWKAKLADRELKRMDRIVRDSLATATTLLDQALARHKGDPDRTKRLATARENVAAANALVNPDTSKTVWRRVASEIEKASLLAHGAAKLVDGRAVTLVQMAVVQGMIGTNGISALVGEKGMEGVIALLGAEGLVNPDTLVGSAGMVAKIATEVRSIDAAGSAKLEAARKAVNTKAPAPTLAKQLEALAQANSALIVKVSAVVSLKPPPPTGVQPPPTLKPATR